MEKNDCKDDSCSLGSSDLMQDIIHTLSPHHEQTEAWHRRETEKKAGELLEVFRKWINEFYKPPV
jgi:hypothetical protein